MSVSRSTTNVDVAAMVATIVFKGTECTSGNVKRLWEGSSRLHVIVKPKYRCTVEGVSLISASIDHFQWYFSTSKRSDYD